MMNVLVVFLLLWLKLSLWPYRVITELWMKHYPAFDLTL